MRTCPKCKVCKNETDFYKCLSRPSGLRPYCKDCGKSDNRRWRLENVDKVKDQKKNYNLVNHASIRSKKLEYYRANKEHIIEVNKTWRSENSERLQIWMRGWVNRNRDKLREAQKRYSCNNSGALRAKEAKRNIAKLNRTPAWSDLHAIKQIYIECARVSRETGIKHHVDHIIPLQGKTVSGLHVPNNLQIITESENTRKGNRYSNE